MIVDDVIKLRRRLVFLRCPRASAVHADGYASIVAIDDSVRIVWINPEPMMIAVRRGKKVEALAAVCGLEHSGIKDVNRVDILGVGEDMREIPGSLAKASVLIDALPRVGAIIGNLETAFFGFN